MNEIEKNERVDAEMRPTRRISLLWFIPLVTLLVGLWLVYQKWSNQDPMITITFHSAQGLEAGKSKIKNRNIEVGEVVSITLNDDLDGVSIVARMSPEVRQHLVEGSRFWVVKPSVGISGISGLETLLSGAYIEFSPGDSKNEKMHHQGLERPPLTPSGTPGLHLTLNSTENFGYLPGDIVLFKGIVVGKIEDVYFNTEERMMYYNAFIEHPYHNLVTTNTRFWDASGISAELTADGVAIKTSGLQALINGGIEFGLPDNEPAGEQITERAYYSIFSSRKHSQARRYQFTLNYIVLMDNNVNGLNVGAPVFIRGIEVGEVVRSGYIPESENLLNEKMKIPVAINLYPARMGFSDSESGMLKAKISLQRWLSKGLTATMRSTNMLFGQQIIELKLPLTISDTAIAQFDGFTVIPSSVDSIGEIPGKISALIDNLNDINFQQIGGDVEQMLVAARDTMVQVKALAEAGGTVLTDVSQQSSIDNLNKTIAEIGVLAQSYSNDSAVNKELLILFQDVSDMLGELEPLLMELNNKPNGLIFTGSREKELEPKRKQP